MNNSYTPQINFSLPQWRISLIFSIIIHILVVSLIFLAPSANKKPETSLITKLITPDEWRKEFPQVKPPVIPPRVNPSNVPPNELFGSHRASRAPKHLAHRNEEPRKESRSMPAPLPVQPKTAVPETNVAPNAINKGSANQVPDVREKPTEKGVEPARRTPFPEARSMPAPLPSLREKLFDREVLGKIARREETRHDNGVTFNTTEFRYESYMLKLKDRIESIWHYPSEEARRGIHGDVYITFTIHKDGRLGDIELERSSGFPALDRAAVQALKEGNPYWPLPDEWGRDSLVVPGHFIYSIYGTYVR